MSCFLLVSNIHNQDENRIKDLISQHAQDSFSLIQKQKITKF